MFSTRALAAAGVFSVISAGIALSGFPSIGLVYLVATLPLALRG
jgi:hypothetical protein